MERHTLVPLQTQRTQHTVDISTRADPSSGIRGPKSVLVTHSVQQSLTKRGFISTLGQSLPDSKKLDGDKCWLIGLNWIISSFMFIQNLLPQGCGKETKGVNAVSFGLIIPLFSCCCADTLSEPYFLWGFASVLFSVSLLVYLPKCREWS